VKLILVEDERACREDEFESWMLEVLVPVYLCTMIICRWFCKIS